jgi:predicted metal-binding membrane protein
MLLPKEPTIALETFPCSRRRGAKKGVVHGIYPLTCVWAMPTSLHPGD